MTAKEMILEDAIELVIEDEKIIRRQRKTIIFLSFISALLFTGLIYVLTGG